MAKNTNNAANVSAVWDPKFHATGTQHTIYAPQAFFDNWMGDDSELKAVVNAWLVENAEVTYPAKKKGTGKGRTVPIKLAPKTPEPTFIGVDDDDI